MTKRKIGGVQGFTPGPPAKFRLRTQEPDFQVTLSAEKHTIMVPEQSPVESAEQDVDLLDEALTERLNKSADCSAALADKLLQGWTLLGEHCPRCITPLMRNKQKQLYCVSCKQWVLTEEEAATRASQHRNHQEGQLAHFENPHIARSPSNAAPPPIQGTGNGQGEGISAARENEMSDAKYVAHFVDKEHVNGHKLPAIQADVSTAPLILPKVNLAMKPETVQTLTVSTLIHKMEEMRGLIAVTQNVGELRELFQALSDCVETIKVVKGLGADETSFVKPWTASTWKE